MPGGPALLAATTGAALLPVAQWFTPGRLGHSASARRSSCRTGGCATRSPAMTQALADAFAGDIAAHPADWHMLQRLWLADLPPREPAG